MSLFSVFYDDTFCGVFNDEKFANQWINELCDNPDKHTWKGSFCIFKTQLNDKIFTNEHDLPESYCLACNGSGVAYWTDGVYGECFECDNYKEKSTEEEK